MQWMVSIVCLATNWRQRSIRVELTECVISIKLFCPLGEGCWDIPLFDIWDMTNLYQHCVIDLVGQEIEIVFAVK